MARTYRLTPIRRLFNVLITPLVKVGLVPARTHLLTAPGRKTGRLFTTPVNLVQRDDQSYLVSPYGEVSWVRNARAAGEVALRRGSKRESRRIQELSAADAVPVLKDYWQQNPITRPFFEADPESPEEAFLAEASRHPVFRLE